MSTMWVRENAEMCIGSRRSSRYRQFVAIGDCTSFNLAPSNLDTISYFNCDGTTMRDVMQYKIKCSETSIT